MSVSPSSILAGEFVTATTTGSHAGTGILTNWQIGWGDGQTSSGTGLPPDTVSHTYASAGTFTARLLMTDSNTLSSAATSTVVVVAALPPSPPLNLTATQTADATVTLNWLDKSSNETSFVLERRVSGVGSFATRATISANVAFYIDTTVSNGSSYDYRVKATNTNGSSAYSNVATIAVEAQDPPDLGGTILNPSLHLTYDGCFGVPITGYSATQDIFGAWASMTGRVVGGAPRIFMLGTHASGAYLYEFSPPNSLATDASQLGQDNDFRGVMVRDWGNIYGEDPTTGNVKRENGPGNICDVDGQILFLNGKLYWQFFSSYNVANLNNRCIGMSVLDDNTGLSVRYGPWRVGGGGLK